MYSRRLPHTMHSENMYIQRHNNKMKIMQKCFCLNELYDKLLLCVRIYLVSIGLFSIFCLFDIEGCARQHKGMFAFIRIYEFANKLRVNTWKNVRIRIACLHPLTEYRQSWKDVRIVHHKFVAMLVLRRVGSLV